MYIMCILFTTIKKWGKKTKSLNNLFIISLRILPRNEADCRETVLPVTLKTI